MPKQNPSLVPGPLKVYSPGGNGCAGVTLKDDVPYFATLKATALSLVTVLPLVPMKPALDISSRRLPFFDSREKN